MTSISNIFSNLDNSKNNKKAIKSSISNNSNNFSNTPSLSQGNKFKNFQKRIQYNLEKKAVQLSGKEGFTGVIDLSGMDISLGGLTNQSNTIVQQNTLSSSQQQQIDNLKQEFQNVLGNYQNLLNEVNETTTAYFQRTTSNNPYLGQNIQFNDGSIYYVTNKGVAKPYNNVDIFNSTSGLNGCPANYTSVNIDLSGSYSLGSMLPTTPALVVGTPMQSGQQCGYEGQNVYVNQIVTNPTTTYKGCYQDNTSAPLMTFIGGSPPPPTAIQNGNFSQPQISNNSYKGYWGNNDIPGWYFNAWLVNTSTDWTFPTPYPSGDQCVAIQAYQYIYQSISLETGVTYSLSFSSTGNNTINITLNSNGTDTQIYSLQPTNQWTSYSTTFTVPTSQNYDLYFTGQSNSNSYYTAIQDIQLNASGTSTGGTYTYSQCQQAAIDGGYKLFALQDMNPSTSQGYCAVGNSLPTATSLGNSYIPSGQTSLWNTNTGGQSGNSATLTTSGSLCVINSGGQSIYSTPNNSTPPSNYVGCYQDKPQRAMTLYNNGAQKYDLSGCQQIAQDNGYAYFGLQNSNSGNNAACGLSNDLSQATKYGKAKNCTKISDGSWSGGGWSNAIYDTNNPSSNYYLILQENGNMAIYLGSSPSDSQGVIWQSNTKGKQQDANPAYAASNGKYGQNWIAAGSTLAAGDFVGSTSGNLALIMQSDGNLVLYTFTNVSNCQKMQDGNTGGGAGANALYKISQVGYPSNVGQVAYIDPNDVLYPYTNKNVGYSTTYTEYDGLNVSGNNIPNASYANATVEQCTTTCNNNSKCSGFVMSNSSQGSTCYPKTGGTISPSSLQNASGYTTYIRNKQPTTFYQGASNVVNNIDSVTYQNYVSGGDNQNMFSLSGATSTQLTQLSKLQSQMDSLTEQINTLTNQFSSGTQNANNQGIANITGLQSYLTELGETNNLISNFDTNIENILKDSDINVLQKNYEYLFWSILAVGVVLISMNIAKK
jgi:hypothetical protein